MSVIGGIRSKKLREMLEEALRQGFTIDRLGSDHLKVYRPGDASVAIVSMTMHEGGPTWKKDRARLRRIGVVLP